MVFQVLKWFQLSETSMENVLLTWEYISFRWSALSSCTFSWMKWTYRPHTQASVTMTMPMAAARDRRFMGPRSGQARAMPARGVWKVSAADAGVCAPGPSRIRARRACVGRAVVRTIICAPDVACGGAGERVPNRAASVDGPLRAGVDSALRLPAAQPRRPRMCVY